MNSRRFALAALTMFGVAHIAQHSPVTESEGAAPTPEANRPTVYLSTGNAKFCGKDLNSYPHPKYATASPRVRIRRERKRALRRLAAKRRAAA